MRIERAILSINSNASFQVDNNDINSITWLNGTTPISVSDIQAALPAAELEVALENLRKERNTKLKDTDFYALSDVTMSSEMTTYRQALRDLPSNYTTSDSSTLTEDLSNLVWPTKP